VRRIRVYVDTSVFGGTADDEFAAASQRFFQRVHGGDFIVLVSELTIRELMKSPTKVQQVLADLPEGSVEMVPADQEAMALAKAYLDEGILTGSSVADALHVATAVVAGAELILSWNFKHIVNYDRIRKYNGVNALRGYPSIEIRSPLEMTYGDEGENV